MLDLLNGFVAELRAAGLPVSLTENLDAMEAVRHIPLEDREAFKYALAATLVKSNAHWKAFETVFEVYFSLRGPEYRVGDADHDVDLAELMEEIWADQQARQADGGGMEGLTPEELAQLLYKALLDRLFGPRPDRSRADARGLFGEFSFDGTTALAAVAHLYDPAAEGDAAITLAEFLAKKLGGRPAVGDRLRFGAVELIVRDMQADAITQVGVELEPAPKRSWRSALHATVDMALVRIRRKNTINSA